MYIINRTKLEHTICLMAISSDFFEIDLPNPLLSAVVVEAFTGLLPLKSEELESLLVSGLSLRCPFVFNRPLPGASVILPLVMVGDAALLGTVPVDVVSGLPLTDEAGVGRDLPAEIGRSGNVVRRFGGVSRGKSGGTIG